MRLLLVAFLSLALALSARAHDAPLSGLRIIVGPDSTLVSVTTHRSELLAAEHATGETPDSSTIDRSIRRRLKVRLDGVPFVPAAASILRDDQNDLVMWQARRPNAAATVDVPARLYPEDPESKMMVGVVRDGMMVQETLLDRLSPSLLSRSESPQPSFALLLRFVREGVLHIFGGLDHICFVLGLLLLGGGLRSLLKTVTAFTVAHSITLTTAVLGLWNPSPRLVEPLIAVSIIAIAAENLRPRRESTRDPRPWFAFGFGLIHGFGFAGALTAVGLPQPSLGAALAGFNLGVEIGQALIVVVVAHALKRLVQYKPEFYGTMVRLVSAGIGLAGLLWLTERLFIA